MVCVDIVSFCGFFFLLFNESIMTKYHLMVSPDLFFIFFFQIFTKVSRTKVQIALLISTD